MKKSQKGNAKKSTKRSQIRTRAKKRMAVARPGNDMSLLSRHLNMILDPCGAPLAETAYSGPTGTIQRFVVTGSLSATTQQAGYIVLVPGGHRDNSAVLANGNTTNVVGYGTSFVPGYTTLNTVAGGARVVGACLQLHWNNSEQTRGGSIACGCIPAGEWQGGSTITTDQLYGLLPRKERIPAGECEIVWNPSPADMEFERVDSSITQSNFDDKNALAFAYQGPVGFAIAFTYTVIYEYVPKPGQGQPAHPTVHRSIPDPVGTLNTALAGIGFKNMPLVDVSKKIMSTMATYTPVGNALRIVKGVAGVVNTLLP